MLTFINHLFKVKSKFFRVLTVIFILIVIGELIIPFQHFFFLGIGIILFYILSLVYLFIHTIKAIRQCHSDVMYILLFLTSYTSNMVSFSWLKFGFYLSFYPFDFLIFILCLPFLIV